MRGRVLAAVVLAVAITACGSSSGGAVRGSGAVDRFNAAGAMRWVQTQLDHGPRPLGSAASRALADELREALPAGRFQAVPHGLRNVIGTVPGRDPARTVVVGAHYDTKDLPGFVGAIDGGSGTAVVVQLARSLKPKTIEPTVIFALFDGEESPRGTPDTEADFQREGLRGSKVAARRLPRAEAMVLLDFVGNRDLSLPREARSTKELWERLRRAAKRVGAGGAFPPRTRGGIGDDHVPFLERGVPAIDLIDFDFPCWHRRCDDLEQVSKASLDKTGEAVLELLRSL